MKMKLKIVTGMMLTLLMASMVTILTSPVLAQTNSTTTVYLDPPTINGTVVDEEFNVNINIRDADEIHGWQAGLIFNATLLNCSGFFEGEFLSNVGTTHWAEGTINNTAGVITYYGCALLGNLSASGDGRLAYLTFKVKEPGVSDLHLRDVKVIKLVDYLPVEVPTNIIDVYTVVLDTTAHTVVTVSNSTGATGAYHSGFYDHSFNPTLKEFSFNVTGPHPGFSNVTIPEALLPEDFLVTIDGIPVSRTVTYNGTHYSINFTYSEGIHKVQITRAPVYMEFQPNPVASFMIDGVEYQFWVAVVTESPYGTGNVVMIFKKISFGIYNFSVYVDVENLLLGEKVGWLCSLVGNGFIYPEIDRLEGVQSASITIEETDTNFTAIVSGPIYMNITYTPYGDNSTVIEDPGDRPYLYDYDGDGFWSYHIQRPCNASGIFNEHPLEPANFNWGAFDIIDYEWYDLEKLLRPRPAGEIKLGALLPLTGDFATWGENELVAAEFAVEEVNELFEDMEAGWTLSLFVEDTQVNPDLCLEKVQYFDAMGIELIVGPLASIEVQAIKEYCDANEILAISHASTFPDLAVPDDYIFRFCPQDSLGQGPAIGRIMYDDGKRYVIPVTRNDGWGVGLEEAVELKFEGLGGTFLTGIRYDPEAVEFSAEAADLASKVSSAIATYGADNVSVLHISFEEVNAFMTACLAYPVLDDIKWYGSDGTCGNGAMLEDPGVRDFAMNVSYPCTIFAPTISDKWEKVRQHCVAELGREPESYAYNVYDTVWVYALSLLEVGAYDSTAFKTVLPTVTRNYFGASGWIELDENGDRKGVDYGIWQITEVSPGTYDWQAVGRYVFDTDSVVWSPITPTPVYVFEPVCNGKIFYVVTESNSTVSDYYFDPDEGPFIMLDVTGPNGTTGFCRVAIPKRLLWVEGKNWTVLVGGDLVNVTVIEEDDYYTHLYFVYNHSAKTVRIIGTHTVGDRSPIVSTESTGYSLYPSLAVDSSGNVHIAWYDDTDYTGSGADYDIFYKRFVPGSGWTITEVVSTESTNHSRYPSLAVDLAGDVHIAWQDYTNYTGCGTDADIFYKRYEVGVGWTTTEIVSTESNSGSHVPSLAVDSSGNVHIAWQDYTNYTGCGIDSDIFYKKYVAGSGWTITEVVSTESTNHSHYPSLAVDLARNVHIAWQDYTNYTGCGADSDIFYERYEVSSGWTITQVVSTQSINASQYPSLAVDLARNVHITWQDETNYMGCGSDWDIFYKYLHIHSTQYPWSIFHHNLRNTGYTESPAPRTNQTLWNYTTSGMVASSPAVADGMVFIGSNDGNVYALDQYTGTHIWNYTTGSSVRSSPAVADGKVYVGSMDGNVYCLDAYTGAHIWNYTTGGGVSSSPAVADGKIYVGSMDNKTYCLDTSTGHFIWNYTTSGLVGSSPAVADGKVYVGSDDTKIYCLDAETKAHIWNYTTSDVVRSSPAVADGKVYVGSFDGNVYCLNASTGDFIWNYTTGDWVFSSPAVADGMLFIGSNDNAVYAFGNIVRVPEDYPTVKEAIEAATPGATIIIAPGTYYEHLVINKTLTIIGKKGSPGSGFNGHASGIAFNITCAGASGTIITNIEITNYEAGILISNSSNCRIYYNIMSQMAYTGITIVGNNAVNNSIHSNTIYSNTIAINLTESSTSNKIYNNTVSLNNIGLNLVESDGNTIYANTISENEVGINATHSDGNTIHSNTICLNNIGLNIESNGNTIYANTISENEVGINMSDSDGNTIYWNNFIDNTVQAISNPSSNNWDHGYPDGGNYWSDYEERYPDVEDVYSGPDQDQLGSDGFWDDPYIINDDNKDNYPLKKPYRGPHDIGITSVTPSKTVVGQGYSLNINLTIINYGIYDEIFNVTIYANTIVIDTFVSITLTSRSSTTITFTWETTGCAMGVYTISANATKVPDDIDITDNALIDGTVQIATPGDLNGDGHVDVSDLTLLANNWFNVPYYNPQVDINNDGITDVSDLTLLADNWFKGPLD